MNRSAALRWGLAGACRGSGPWVSEILTYSPVGGLSCLHASQGAPGFASPERDRWVSTCAGDADGTAISSSYVYPTTSTDFLKNYLPLHSGFLPFSGVAGSPQYPVCSSTMGIRRGAPAPQKKRSAAISGASLAPTLNSVGATSMGMTKFFIISRNPL